MNYTDQYASAYVERAIAESGENPEHYRIYRILPELRKLAGGWNFEKIEHDAFWRVLLSHKR